MYPILPSTAAALALTTVRSDEELAQARLRSAIDREQRRADREVRRLARESRRVAAPAPSRARAPELHSWLAGHLPHPHLHKRPTAIP